VEVEGVVVAEKLGDVRRSSAPVRIRAHHGRIRVRLRGPATKTVDEGLGKASTLRGHGVSQGSRSVFSHLLICIIAGVVTVMMLGGLPGGPGRAPRRPSINARREMG
jgi:hypothetical protein